MRQQLEVLVSLNSKTPFAEVPCECMWDLIEYLSYQRVAVHYDFKETYFTVSFPKQAPAAAQQLLDEWTRCTVMEYA